MCSAQCNKHSTVCEEHIELNKKENKSYKDSVRNMEEGSDSVTATMIIDTTLISKESERIYEDMCQRYRTMHTSTECLDDPYLQAEVLIYDVTHKTMSLITNPTVQIEDRTKNKSKFEYVDMEGLDGRRVRAVFDTGSKYTLVLREIVERGALIIEEIPDLSQCVMGIGR